MLNFDQRIKLNMINHLLPLAVVALLSSTASALAQRCINKYGGNGVVTNCKSYNGYMHGDPGWCQTRKWYCFGFCCDYEDCSGGWSQWSCAVCNGGYYRSGSERADNSANSASTGWACPSCGTGYACADGTRDECEAGTYQDGNTATSCKNCPGGYYQDANGQSDCKECPIGTFGNSAVSNADSGHCQSCTPGRYQDQKHQTSRCKLCPAGLYGSTNGQTVSTCTGKCAAGWKCSEGSSGAYQDSCSHLDFEIIVANNQYCPSPDPDDSTKGPAKAKTVPAGSYSSTSHSNTPSGQDAKFYRDTTSLCPKGKMCVGGVQLNCPLGHYQDQLGQSDCNGKICTSGYYCNAGATSSTPGSAFDCGDIEHYCPNKQSSSQ